MRSDSTWRVLLYCAAEPLPHGHFNQSDINFPQQLEIKVNHNEVKANFKGLKNKAGSTLPADITGFIRKQAAYGNIISITYALTSKVSGV
jgi:E3 SUMO-protein ligase PIAS1